MCTCRGGAVALSDAYELDLATMTWTDISGKPGAPSARNSMGMDAIGHRVYVFGGRNVAFGK